MIFHQMHARGLVFSRQRFLFTQNGDPRGNGHETYPTVDPILSEQNGSDTERESVTHTHVTRVLCFVGPILSRQQFVSVDYCSPNLIMIVDCVVFVLIGNSLKATIPAADSTPHKLVKLVNQGTQRIEEEDIDHQDNESTTCRLQWSMISYFSKFFTIRFQLLYL